MTHDEAKMIFDLIGFGTSDRDLVQIFCDFSRVVAEAEREACADICDHEMDNAISSWMIVAAGNCADKIRARGQA